MTAPSAELSPPGPADVVRHVYVHVPFCHRICPYCSFHKHLPGSTDLNLFCRALVEEARRAAQELSGRLQPQTLYFGGGTPTFLSTTLLERLLPELLQALGLACPAQLDEWSVEINPRTIDAAKAALLRRCGVTRTSLGVQSWDPPVLATLGRDHSPQEAAESWQILRDAGFPVASLDLMFSVPGQSLDSWRTTLERSLQLEPDHISAYNLTYEEDTAFFEKHTSGEYQKDEGVDDGMFTTAAETLTAAGFAHYEVSNYARPGRQSLHNSAYWAGRDYLGLGPGAVSTIGGQRWKNAADTPAWMAQVLAGKSVREEREEIDAEKFRCERIALMLRTSAGLPRVLLDGAEERIALLEAEGMLIAAESNVCLTRYGRKVADSIADFLWAG